MSKISLKFIKSTIKVLLGSVGATLLTLGSVESASVPCYSIVDLGTLPGYDSSISTKLNKLGQVVGYSFREKDWHFRSFLWENGVIKDIGTLGGDQSIAWDINNSGKVVGLSYTGQLDPNGNSLFHAFIRNNNAGMIDITPYAKDTTRSEAINDQNQIIVSQGNQAFVFNNGIESNLCTSLSRGCFAYDINNSGLIVGYSEVTLRQICQLVDENTTACFDVTARRAHLWDNGNIKNLGTIGDATEEFNWSQAVAINDNGQIVGDANHKCVLWNQDGTITDLGASGSDCVAKGINNKGWVVGSVSTNTPNPESRAFLWRKNQGVEDLNNLIRPNSGWVLNSANSINDAGYITGDGIVNGKNRAFLLIPNHSSK
jgi:probable HAF family extracellular repeat protein